MHFSQRVGEVPFNHELQVTSADQSLRIALWNCVWRVLIDDPWAKPEPILIDEYIDDIWEFFFKRPMDERGNPAEVSKVIKQWVLTCDWYQIYDLAEFMCTILPPNEVQAFEVSLNRVFEAERSAYRIIYSTVVPVSDAQEIEAITLASLRASERGIGAVRDRLSKAVKMLGQRKNPDLVGAVLNVYRAVGLVASELLGVEDGSGKDALQYLENLGAVIPARIMNSAEMLFPQRLPGGTFPAEATEDLELPEARFLVVTGTAIINYMLAEFSELPGSESDHRGELGGGANAALPPTPE